MFAPFRLRVIALMLHVQKWQRSWLWVLTHFQVFHSHSIQDRNTEEKQDSVTHNIYSQQGGARSTAGIAAGCGKKTHEETLRGKTKRAERTNLPSVIQGRTGHTPCQNAVIHAWFPLAVCCLIFMESVGTNSLTRFSTAPRRLHLYRSDPACRPSHHTACFSYWRQLSTTVII